MNAAPKPDCTRGGPGRRDMGRVVPVRLRTVSLRVDRALWLHPTGGVLRRDRPERPMTHRPPPICPPVVGGHADEARDDPTLFVHCAGRRLPRSDARAGGSVFAALPGSPPPMAPAPHRPRVAVPASPFRVETGPAPPPDVSVRLPVVLAVGALLLAVCGVALFTAGLAASAPPGDHPELASGRARATGMHAQDTGAEPGSDTGSEPEEGAVTADRAGPLVHRPGERSVATTAPAVGELVVTLPDPRGVRHLTVSCPSGFRRRSAYDIHPLVVSGVPTSEACTAAFQGASPHRFHGVRGGMRLTCRFDDGMTHCQQE